MSHTPAIQVENLTVKYPNTAQPVVEAISFSIEPHTIAAVIGPNGSGKSTLIKAMLGLVPYSGHVRFYGQPRSKLHHQIGYVPQRFAFDRTIPITTDELLHLALATCTHSNQEKQHMVAAVFQKLEINALARQPLASLSGGQLQRVLLARALVHEPNFLILDEPEAGIDVGGELIFYNLLEELVHRENLTAIVVSHELEIVRSYADRVICLNRTLVCNGTPRQVFSQSNFIKLYGSKIAFHRHGRHPH